MIHLSLTPYRKSLGLDSCNSIDDSNGAVEDSQGTLHFNRKVDVPRGVDDVHSVPVPLAPHARTLNRDA